MERTGGSANCTISRLFLMIFTFCKSERDGVQTFVTFSDFHPSETEKTLFSMKQLIQILKKTVKPRMKMSKKQLKTLYILLS